MMKPTSTPTCPTCHQFLGEVRFGVRLTPLKARIVDRIKAAGDIGVSSEELLFALWEEGAVTLSDGRRWFLSWRGK